MLTVKNNGSEPCTFVVGREKNGEPKTVSIAPGEDGSVDLDAENPQIKGKLLASVIEVSKGGAAHKKPE